MDDKWRQPPDNPDPDGGAFPAARQREDPSALERAADDFWRQEEWLRVPPPPAAPAEGMDGMRRKKKKRPLRRLLRCLLALVFVTATLAWAAVFRAAGNMDIRPLTREQAAARAAVRSESPLVSNILLLGVDDARSDTMLLLSVDLRHGKLKLTSILRDSWVRFPDGSYDKINAAAARGGGPLAMRVVSENFGLRVDHYMLIDFRGFKKMIDALGGVTVEVTEKEAKFINRTAPSQKGNFPAGRARLTGQQALIYARIRKLDDDFMRTQRQRKVVSAIAAACAARPWKLFDVLQKGLPEIRTDMSRAQVASLALRAPVALGGFAERQVPAKGTFSYTQKKNMAVISLNLEENARLLREFIYGP